jgi:hypothetical protein
MQYFSVDRRGVNVEGEDIVLSPNIEPKGNDIVACTVGASGRYRVQGTRGLLTTRRKPLPFRNPRYELRATQRTRPCCGG